MFADLIRIANREIVGFLARAANSEAGQKPASSIEDEGLLNLCKRLTEVGAFFPFSRSGEVRDTDWPQITEYEHNLVHLRALLERAQADLAARRELLRSQLVKLRSASAWASTFNQTR